MIIMSSAKNFIRKIIGERAVRTLQEQRRRMGLVESGPIISHLAAVVWPSKFEAWHRRRTFQDAYQNGRWGAASGEKFFSGQGSRGRAVEVYLDFLNKIIDELYHNLQRDVIVVDLGCGDFSVGQQLVRMNSNVQYIGCDIVPEIIEHHKKAYSASNVSFKPIDIVSDQPPPGDVVLVRQVLQHLSNANTAKVIDKLNKYSKVIITEGQPKYKKGPINPDKPVGSGMRFDWRTGQGRGLELDKPPFNLRTEIICRVQSTDVEMVETYLVHL